jgi:hypothetical protein
VFVKVAPESMFDDILTAWKALPRPDGFLLPTKKSFSPVSLRKHLQNLGIAEHKGQGRLVVRLAGTNSREFWGEEVTGRKYDQFPGGAPEEVLLPPEVIGALFNQPCGMHSLREAEDKEGNPWQSSIFSLPLADNEGTAKFLLYGFRVFPLDESLPAMWEPGFADLSTARLISAEFVDIGYGTPG